LVKAKLVPEPSAHRGDGGVRQVQAGVQRLDGGVVPLGDLAQVDVAQHLAAQAQLAGSDALDVDHGDHATDDGRELHQALLGQLFVLQRRIGGAEVHRLRLDLAQAGAGAHRLVVDPGAGRLVVVGRPLGVQRRREAGAGAGHVLRGSQAGEGQAGQGRGGDTEADVH
jgi:hypothetical protein